MKMTQIDLTVVIAIYNEEQVLNPLYERLVPVITSISQYYEVIFIDDGSHDRSWEIIENLSKNQGCVEKKYLKSVIINKNIDKTTTHKKKAKSCLTGIP